MDAVLEDRTQKLFSPDLPHSEAVHLPTFPPIIESAFDSQILFEYAKSQWESTLTIKSLEQVLSDISTSNHPPSQSRFRELKGLRKDGLILLSAWNLFDKHHIAPSTYWRLVKSLGELNDSYFTSNASNHACITSRALQDYLETKDSFKFKPADQDSYHAYITTIARRMGERLEQEALNGEDLHAIRKTGTRFFMNAYQLAHRVHPDNNSIKGSFDWLHEVDKKLGTIKDEMEATSLQEQTITLDPALRRELQVIIQSFR